MFSIVATYVLLPVLLMYILLLSITVTAVCIGASKFRLTPGLEAVPILHCHGDADPVVSSGDSGNLVA